MREEPDWVAEAFELRDRGLGPTTIARRLGVKPGQVQYRFNRHKWEERVKYVTIECVDCGLKFETRAKGVAKRSGKCQSCKRAHGPSKTLKCEFCGDPFVASHSQIQSGRRYCCRACWKAAGGSTRSAEGTERVRREMRQRNGKRNPNYRHGKRTGEHDRELLREFNVRKKGETRCRCCGSERTIQPHHAVPRSLSRKGRLDLRNCLPLCAVCHTSWHRRSIVVYRDIFTQEEWEFISTLIGPGWLDDRYPERELSWRKASSLAGNR